MFNLPVAKQWVSINAFAPLGSSVSALIRLQKKKHCTQTAKNYLKLYTSHTHFKPGLTWVSEQNSGLAGPSWCTKYFIYYRKLWRKTVVEKNDTRFIPDVSPPPANMWFLTRYTEKSEVAVVVRLCVHFLQSTSSSEKLHRSNQLERQFRTYVLRNTPWNALRQQFSTSESRRYGTTTPQSET